MTFRVAALLLVMALSLAFAPAASAQGCAMCYSSAAGQDAKAQKALDAAIFTLVSPIFLLAGGVVLITFKRRNAPGEGDDEISGVLDSELGSEVSPPRVFHLPLDSDSSGQTSL